MTTRPEWYRETHQYLVHGGPVASRTDGQIHHVSEWQVARLYGLMTALGNVLLFRSLPDATSYAERSTDRSTVHIVGPRSDGDYRVPDSVELWRRQQLADAAVRVDPDGPVRGRGDATVHVHDSVLDHTALATRYARLWLMSQQVEEMRRAGRDMGMVMAQAWSKATTVPKEGSRAWNRVVKKGCVGERDKSGDFSCGDYDWGCDNCPVVVERMRHEGESENSVRGNRMHRFWRSKRKEKAKNEIDFNHLTMVGIDLASPDGDRTVVFFGGRRAGRATPAKKYRKD